MPQPSPAPRRDVSRYIRIRGAAEHNLKNIDLDIPRNQFVVMTGLSGSGKSSLAFDTIYAEGQRRYMESLSSYARQFLGQMEKPKVESIEGLPPAISIDQKSTNHNPRSTVGTVTEIYDYFRLLYARCGIVHCPECGREIKRQTVDQMADALMALPEKTRLQMFSPVVRGRKGQHEKVIAQARKSGYVRIRVDGNMYELSEEIRLDKNIKHNIEILVDRLVVKDGIRKRLTESLEQALQQSGGIIYVEAQRPKTEKDMHPDHLGREDMVRGISAAGHGGSGKENTAADSDAAGQGAPDFADNQRKRRTPAESEGENDTHKGVEVLTFSENYACPYDGTSIEEIEPRSFSFNNPFGACPECTGLGYRMEFDEDLMIPDKSLSIDEGAIVVPGWQSSRQEGSFTRALLDALAREYGFRLDTPFADYPPEIHDVLINGTDGREVKVHYKSQRGVGNYDVAFEGLIRNMQRRYRETFGEAMKAMYESFMRITPCKACGGQKLKKGALAVTVDGKNIYEMTMLSIGELLEKLETMDERLSGQQLKIGAQILKEIRARVSFLNDVGLDYLSLARRTATLSGGEAQRIRLATQIGSGLVGVAYILDEPSIGLHQRDNDKLLGTLFHLRDLGNTVIVVEHDEDTMRSADVVIDIGPGAGDHGGQVVAVGTADEIQSCAESITGKYLSGELKIPVPASRRTPNGWLTVRGARENNLKNIDVRFPLGTFTCVTGVSGSGKSSLVNEILYRDLANRLNRAHQVTGKRDGVEWEGKLDKVIQIDQSPIGRTPRSNPATYTGVFDHIRDLFASTNDAKARGFKKGRFSFNVKGGRCEACAGDGIIKIEMNFLPDVYVPCEVCHGKRYNRETLDVRYKGKNIFEVLDMTVEEALKFFDHLPSIRTKIQTLYDVGLGYIRLGQPSTQLSGGEAQRIKLAAELSRRSTGRTVYILDEPTTGLHFADVHKLTDILQRLTDGGNTVIVIEHNLDVIKNADYLIDLGPEGGEGGGMVVAAGTPEEVAKVPESFTGQYVKKYLKG